MLIRTERETDFRAIYDLVKSAFATAKVADGDEQYFVERRRRSGGYVPELALIVEDGEEIIGHVMLTKVVVSTATGRQSALLLAPLSVVLARRRQRIGATLVMETLDRARRAGYAAVLVLGDPAYYGRFGFRPSAEFGIRSANAIEDPFVLALALTPGGLTNLAGSVALPT